MKPIRGCLTVIGAIVVIVIIIAVATSSSGSSHKAPRNFKATPADINATIASAVDGGDSPGLAKKPHSFCRGGQTARDCFVRYTIKEPAGISAALELISPTRPIFKALFGVSNVSNVHVKVSGPTISMGGKHSNSPLFSLTCSRQEATQIDWHDISASALEQICTFDQLVKSL